MDNNIQPIALTAGDPTSIATELLFKSWLQLNNHPEICFFTINNLKYLRYIQTQLGFGNIPIAPITSPQEARGGFHKYLPVIDIPWIHEPSLNGQNPSWQVTLGEPNSLYVPFIINSLTAAIGYAIRQEVKAIMTMPIEKSIMRGGGFDFMGHTDFLAQQSNATMPIMLLATPSHKLKVVPIKIHISLKESINTLSTIEIINKICSLHSELQKYLKSPIKIGVLGLNPHAGEQGLMGDEELNIIIPAIKHLTQQGILVEGPLAADSAFNPLNLQVYDVIVGMYHDQVLTPFKTLYFEEGVNVTLGLPFLRTSPDHGTALDIAPQNIANPSSVIAAITLAHQWTK